MRKFDGGLRRSHIDARTRPFLDAGRATFERRQGQLNLACAQCHDTHWGRRLAGDVIPQAQASTRRARRT